MMLTIDPLLYVAGAGFAVFVVAIWVVAWSLERLFPQLRGQANKDEHRERH